LKADVASSAVGRVKSARLEAVADAMAAAAVISLPWSTTATGILVTLWLLVLIPTLDMEAVKRAVLTPAGGLPVLLWLMAVVGTLWADASLAERLKGLESFHKLLAIPLLLAQFGRSRHAPWVSTGFLISCTVLLMTSYAHALSFGRLPWATGLPGVPVKDYITQSGVFAICILGLLYVFADAWRAGRRRLALALAGLAALFVADIVYVTTSRTTLVAIPILITVFGLRRLGARGTLGLVVGCAAVAAVLWVSSPYMRFRVSSVVNEVSLYRAEDAVTSSGLRMEFWRKSLQFVAQAPLIGHGTGTIHALFSKAVTPGGGASSVASSNPHQQILAVAIQLGLIGAVVLLAMWAAHLVMFAQVGFVAWCGLIIVTQNVVGSMFNSHLLDFTQGWLYVFGVGVFGGALLKQHAMGARFVSEAPVASAVSNPA
jgi:O-antigen ligase